MSVEVVFAYQAADESQLSLTVGEKITVMQRNDGGWWIGSNPKGQVGIFPSSYCKMVKEKPKFNVPKETKTAMLHEDHGGASGGGGGALGGSSGGLSASGSGGVGSGGASSQEARRREQERRHEMGELLGLQSADFSNPSSALIDQIADAKREFTSLKDDVAKLKSKKRDLDSAKQGQQTELTTLHKDVTNLKGEIRRKSNSVANKELELEVLRCAMEGLPLPDYNPITEEVPVGNTPGSAMVQSTSPARGGGGGSDTSLQRRPSVTVQEEDPAEDTESEEEEEEIPEVPPEEMINEDNMARKIIKKLRKRISEAEVTSQEYEKQGAKLQRRINKHTANLEKIEATNAAKGLGGSDSPMSPMYTPEVQEELEAKQAQLVKLQSKISKVTEALGDNEVLAALQKDLKKLEKRLAKGNDANEQLQKELKVLDQQASEGMAAMQRVKESLAASAKRKAEVAARLGEAQKQSTAAVDAKKKEAEALYVKIEKEEKRIAEFKEELAKLQAAQDEAVA